MLTHLLSVHTRYGTLGRRTRRRLKWAAAAGIGLVFAGAQQAPYAQVWPGPTPDLTAAVAAAQGPGHRADPALRSGGRFLATTVEAEQMSWLRAAWCATGHGCSMLPVDTSDPSAMAQARRDMTSSESDAQAAAHVLVGAASTYPTADLTADMGQVAGPSAGLMLTLSFVDALTPGDLTGGRVIAGTGTIDQTGAVGPIGGIGDKVAGAHLSGATVFFAPADQAQAAAAVAPAGLTVVGVRTAGDAVRWLCTHGGHSSACAYY